MNYVRMISIFLFQKLAVRFCKIDYCNYKLNVVLDTVKYPIGCVNTILKIYL